MWALVDKNTLPTPGEIKKTKQTIVTLEGQLEDALEVLRQAVLRVNALSKEIQERKAWISPIRKVPFEVVSLIFEHCGEEDWLSPLRVAAVSRSWRTIVLATPRAWSFIDLTSEVGLKLSEIYFTRNGDRKLHIALLKSAHLGRLAQFTNRIQCLSIADIPPNGIMRKIRFPHLTRITVPHMWHTPLVMNPARITRSSFPALRYLNIQTPILRGTQYPQFPQLESLAIKMTAGRGWHNFLLTCRLSLISLHIRCDKNIAPGENIHIPGLQCLTAFNQNDDSDEESELDSDEEDDQWRLALDTPCLKAYIEDHLYDVPNPKPFYENMAQVTHLRITRPPSLSEFPKLHFLQLRLNYGECIAFLDELEFNDRDCLSLQMIEFDHGSLLRGQLENLRERLEAWEDINRPGLRRPVISMGCRRWSMEFPGEIHTECAEGMDCGE